MKGCQYFCVLTLLDLLAYHAGSALNILISELKD